MVQKSVQIRMSKVQFSWNQVCFRFSFRKVQMGWESKCEWKEAKGETEDFKKRGMKKIY